MSARVRPVGGLASTTLSILTASTRPSFRTRSPVNGDLSAVAGAADVGGAEGVGVADLTGLAGAARLTTTRIVIAMRAATTVTADTVVITIARRRNGMAAPLNQPSVTSGCPPARHSATAAAHRRLHCARC